MSKKTKPATESNMTDSEQPENETETTQAETEAPPTALATAPVTPSIEIASPTLKNLVGRTTPEFAVKYASRLRVVTRPSQRDMLQIVSDLPEEYREGAINLLRKLNPDRPGLYLADMRPQLTELRVFQGTGNDPNRPDNCRVGELYLTSKQNVGPSFTGVVLALWQGRTMWPSADDARSAPLCTSMDRVVGSQYGRCETCPQRPWRDGEKTSCNDDVVAFMVPKDLSDILLVRFSRTSESSGRQLAKFAAKDLVPWQRYYQLTTKERSGAGNSKTRWFILRTEPTETMSPPALTEFYGALCNMAEHDFILPGLARIYNDASRLEEDTAQVDKGDGTTTETGANYGDFE